jgi:hypothetical protein
LLVLVDGKFLMMRVPYPMGYCARGVDGRIDNPNGGYKGKAILQGVRGAASPEEEAVFIRRSRPERHSIWTVAKERQASL